MNREEMVRDLKAALDANDIELAQEIDRRITALGSSGEPMVAKPKGGPATAIASGVNKGVLSYIPGMLGDTLLNASELVKAGLGVGYHELTGKGIPRALESVSDRSSIPLTSDWFQKLINSTKTGRDVIEAGSEQYPALHAGGTAVGASLLGAKSAPVKVGTTAFSSGAASQKVGEKTGSKEAALLTALGIPAVTGVAYNVVRDIPKLLLSPAPRQADAALRPYTDAQIKAGIELQKAGEAAKLPLQASQAMGGGGRLVDLENYAMDSPYAPKTMLQRAQSQPQRGAQLSDVTTRYFGKPDTSLSRANQIEAAADSVLEAPRRAASKSVQPLYDLLNRTRPQLPESVRWKLAGELDSLNKKVGLLEQSSAGSAVEDVASKATVKSPIVSAQGVNFRRAEGGIYELDNYLKEIRTRIEALSKVNPDAKQLVERAGLSPAASSIRQALVENSSVLAQAKDQYHSVKKALDESIRSTAIPDMSRRFNAPDVSTKTAAQWPTLEKLLTRRQSPEDLTRASTYLGKFDKQAVSDVFKSIVRHKFDDVFGKTEHIDDAAPARFAQSVKSLPNLDTAVEITAKANGASNPKLAAAGFKRLLDVIEASGLPKGGPGGGSTPSQIEQRSVGKSAASLLFGHGIARAGTLVRNVQYALNKEEVQLLINTLDSPRSLEKLVQLSKVDKGSQLFNMIVNDLTRPQGDIGQAGLYGTISEVNQ